MSVATDFRAWLLTQGTITQFVGQRIGITFEDEDDTLPYITFRRSGHSQETDLDGVPLPETTRFDLEVRADTPSQGEQVADAIKALVLGFPQASLVGDARRWNDRVIQYAEVNDQDDDYEILPVGSHETDSIIALSVEVISDA